MRDHKLLVDDVPTPEPGPGEVLVKTLACGRAEPSSVPVDPYLVAAKMTEDAVLAYHTALEFHGRAYSVHWRLVYVSASKSRLRHTLVNVFNEPGYSKKRKKT